LNHLGRNLGLKKPLFMEKSSIQEAGGFIFQHTKEFGGKPVPVRTFGK